jgi:hypothetical protein
MSQGVVSCTSRNPFRSCPNGTTTSGNGAEAARRRMCLPVGRSAPRRNGAATLTDTSAAIFAGGGLSQRPTQTWNKQREPQTAGTFCRNRTQSPDRRGQFGPTGGCYPVRAATLVVVGRLDKAPFFQSRDRAVQRSGSQRHAGELLNIAGQRVPMLRARSQTGQDQHTCIVGSPELRAGPRGVSHLTTLVRSAYYGKRSTTNPVRRRAGRAEADKPRPGGGTEPVIRLRQRSDEFVPQRIWTTIGNFPPPLLEASRLRPCSHPALISLIHEKATSFDVRLSVLKPPCSVFRGPPISLVTRKCC